jgi:hypothetical protein
MADAGPVWPQPKKNIKKAMRDLLRHFKYAKFEESKLAMSKLPLAEVNYRNAAGPRT